MLWRKDSKRSDAIYIDYFAKLDLKTCALDDIFNRNKPPLKSNVISDELRNQGNIEFQAKNWNNAIIAFNYALCFAEKDSEALSLAYGNRSACFFEMDRFDNSINDIDLAEQASVCSAELKELTEQQRSDCLDFIGDDTPNDNINHGPKLDFDSNEAFPALANVLQIERLGTYKTKECKYRITANDGIDVGQTICVEKSMIATLLSNQYTKCSICFAKSGNLVPCENCTGAMFCRDKCQHSILHEAECNLNPDINVDGKLQFLIRTVAYAMNLFGGINEFMEFVERSNACKFHDMPLTMTDERAKYQHFLKLRADRAIVSGKKRDPFIYFAYKAIMNSKAGHMIESEKQKRFMVHLIWQHNAIISLGHVLEYTNKQQVADSLNLSLLLSHFTHSCTPNAMYYLVNDKLAIVALTPIKPGEEIFVSYFGKTTMLVNDSNKQRKDDLKNLSKCFGKKCKCDACSKCKKPDERPAMQQDGCYKFLDCCFSSTNPDGSWEFEQTKDNPLDIKQIKENAMIFLRKYGKCAWCEELAKVASCFMDIVWLQSDFDDGATLIYD